MNDNKMHGRVLKKLREERGYKLLRLFNVLL